MIRRLSHWLTAASVSLTTFILAAPAHAAGSSMPWEAPLEKILQ